MAINISLEELLNSGAHFGHQARRWNPKMSPYLYGEQEGTHVFDLVKTKEALENAINILSQAKSEGKTILFVGTKKQVKEKLKEMAIKLGYPYIAERWLGGILTNFDQIKKSIKKLADLKQNLSEGLYNKFTKKERLLIEREIARLERFLGGLSTLNRLPDFIFIVDVHREKGAALEAKRMGVPVVAIVDSNSDPDLVDWPIPMNDDASKALDYALGIIEKALLEVKIKVVKIKKSEQDEQKS